MFKKTLHWMSVLVLLGLSACGATEMGTPDVLDGESPLPLDSSQSNLIIGEEDWVDATLLPTDGKERARSKAVGYLYIAAKKERCTAWLASKDVIITNSHCIKNSAEAVGARVSFNYETGSDSHSRIWFQCPTFIQAWGAGTGEDAGEDIAALRCLPLNNVYPGQMYGYLTVADTDAPKDTPIYVIHQNCNFKADKDCDKMKKYSPGKVLKANSNDFWMWHDADTLDGSSGGPMLSQSSHRVVGMNRGNNGSVNVAVRASIIKSRLAKLKL